MFASFPADLAEFMRQEVADGKYGSEQELMVEAVRLLREHELQLQQFHSQLQGRLEQAGRGEVIELENENALGTFLDAIEAEVLEEQAAAKQAEA